MKNQNHLSVKQTGYGHWLISTTYYSKEINCITTNSTAIDDYSCDEFKKDGRELRKNRGYKDLRSEIIRLNR